ncbi:exodeoxyribonuclease VII large subunit [Acidithiobacillus sp.]|uniref:exodeoxyribonuclease VII large subunit n=1 Tax=Acidithiobacillus sp. TaxID=1872118 RepID=UPI002621663A|nr:exodeoxyribonuclease VII large subunit [Acidithiobacillus sp.]
MTIGNSQIPILTVSALNGAVREIIEGNFPLLRVEGELSNFSSPGSGHWYFSLKDARAQVRCAMFHQRNTYTRIQPRNGMQVQVLAQPTLYEGRGDFQLIVEQLLNAGEGELQARFAALREKLATEGLFAPELKRPLPRWPLRVAVVTSTSGAALHDIRVTLARRWPMLAVMVYPVLVQGDQAAAQICTALGRIARRQQEDVAILARGGGSAEDLWCFNEESVARAIRACPVPVVTGIGHEIDFTIADFAGDLRAATPTAAAEAVSPDRAEWLPQVQAQRRQLEQSMQRTLRDTTQRLDYLRLRLRHPGERVQDAERRLGMAREALRQAMRRRQAEWSERLLVLQARRLRQDPRQRLQSLNEMLETRRAALILAINKLLVSAEAQQQQQVTVLRLLDPLAVLQRGFAVLRDESGKVIFGSKSVAVHAQISATLARGTLVCEVVKTSD